MSEPYLLGHTEREWGRLAEQHALWGPALLQRIRAAGVGAGSNVLEVGCGSGELLRDLVALTAPSGSATGFERDPAAVERASRYASVTVGDLRLDPLGGPFDAVVARWVLSFVPDALPAIFRAVKPGGVVVIQDYNHDGVAVWPRHRAIDDTIEAFREAYRRRGGDLWIGAKAPRLLHDAGFVDLRATVDARIGSPGEPVWRWVERFVFEHVDGLVDGGLLTARQREELRIAWNERALSPGTVLFTPMLVTLVARRPTVSNESG